ncbi:MAG TPA: hypothetical protein VFW07_14805 [Parafilimonas sp.]|nr:hypothetical protein [Parafilimonas sp.]
MIKNYFKTAWRNLSRYKAYSIINVLGLTLGIVRIFSSLRSYHPVSLLLVQSLTRQLRLLLQTLLRV